MKKITLLIVLTFIIVTSFAQVPNNFKYQAVVRDATGNVLPDQNISVQISILQGSMTGMDIYIEDFNITTNSFGLINLNIGSGNTSDDFSTIDWAAGPYFLKVEIDENGGTAYSEMGTSQLLSVPFALYAKDVENKDDADADPNNEMQTLNINNDTLYLTNGGQIYLGQYSNQWQENGNNIYYNDGWVGVGTNNPSGKMVVQGDASVDPDSALFEVKNKDGQTIFAVYDGGVRIWVDDTGVKANTDKGGFAVGGYRLNKSISNEYLRITPDSARIYYDNENTGTGHQGGFQVEGFAGSTSESNGGTMHLSDDNYFIGDSAGINISSTGLYNSVFGYKAGKSLTDGDANVFLGYNAGMSNTTGYNNIFIGNKAGVNNQEGMGNVFIGNGVGHNITGSSFPNGSANVFIGDSCGYFSTGGYTNVFVGYAAGKNNNIGYANIFLGYNAGLENNDGAYNLFLGYQSGRDLVDGSGNTFLGNNAGVNATGGDDNIFIGPLAGRNQSSGDNNIYIGESAGYGFNANNGKENIFIGSKSGYENLSGENNVFIGYKTGTDNTTGKNNIYIGNNAGGNIATGNFNVYLGDSTGYNNNGSYNLIMGYQAGKNYTSSNNVYLGAGAGEFSNSGNNVFIGNSAGMRSISGENVQIGTIAGYNNTAGGNVFIGSSCVGGTATSVANSVIIGTHAGQSSTGSNQIFIGYEAGKNATGDNKLYIENSGSNTPLIYGEFDNDYVKFNSTVHVKDLFVMENNNSLTVVSGTDITPVNSYYRITSSSAVTIGKINDGTYVGQVLIIENRGSNGITINDNTSTANTRMAGNCTLYYSDNITFVWNGFNWTEISRSNH